MLLIPHGIGIGWENEAHFFALPHVAFDACAKPVGRARLVAETTLRRYLADGQTCGTHLYISFEDSLPYRYDDGQWLLSPPTVLFHR